MRLVSVNAAGFRGFPRPVRFNVDADVVIFAAPNGQGKTSFFDAVMWTLTGMVPRLGDDGAIISLFAPSLTASVSVELRREDGRPFRVTRSTDGSEQILALDDAGEITRGPSAEAALLASLWPAGLVEVDPFKRLAELFSRSSYLQQDVIRGFVDEDDPAARFRTIEGLVGVGRITELQRLLEGSRRGWNTETSASRVELERLEAQMSRVRGQLDSLTEVALDDGDLAERWTGWRERAAALGARDTPVSLDLSRALDVTLNEVESLLRTRIRRLSDLRELLGDIRALANLTDESAQAEELRSRAAGAESSLQDLRIQLNQEQSMLAAERRRLVEAAESREQLRALASLALQHLTPRCPVCNQTHVLEETRRHLTETIYGEPNDSGQEPDSSRLSTLAKDVEAAELEVAELSAAVDSIEHREHQREVRQSLIRQRLETLRLPATWSEGSIIEDIARLEEDTRRLTELRAEGDGLALATRRLAEVRLRSELLENRDRLASQIAIQGHQLGLRQRTSEVATTVIDALQDAAESLVEIEIGEISPLLSRIYSRMDPHPVFRSPSVSVRMLRRRGQLYLTVSDPLTATASESPGTILSSSQSNAFAIAIFLSLNLGFSPLATESVLMDDPLQSLDDVNLLGLVDLLRRTKAERQVILGTHDRAFAELLARKLRPVTASETALLIELDGWGREGPRIKESAIPTDRLPVRIAG